MCDSVSIGQECLHVILSRPKVAFIESHWPDCKGDGESSSEDPQDFRIMFSEVLASDFGSKIEHCCQSQSCCQSRPLTAKSFAARIEHSSIGDRVART